MKLTNIEKEKRYKKRKILRIIIIILGFLTMLFAIDYLVRKDILSIILSLIFLIIETILSKYRESLKFDESKN